MGTPYILFKIFAFIWGAMWGSFANVLIYRIPRGMSIIKPSSHCPHCKKKIPFYENIPILSYIVLKGRCSKCKNEISFRYPVVELIVGILSVASVVKLGGVMNNFSEVVSFIPHFLFYFYFIFVVIVISFIDIDTMTIPDSLSIPLIFIGFLYALFFFPENPVSFKSSILGILIGGGIFFLLRVFYFKIRKIEGLGGGDIKMIAMIGAFFGIQSIPFVLFAGSLQGLIFGVPFLFFKKLKSLRFSPVPFGPFLSLSSLQWLFFREEILNIFEKITNSFTIF